jgi:LysR family cys regulon transcriptional activator
MNLQQIQAACTVARNGLNISAAAVSLNKSQSAVSRQIKELEIDLGLQIFLRTRNRVVGLTPQGESALQIIERMQDDMTALQKLSRSSSAAAEGEIRIATTHIYARYVLPKAIKTLSDRFPKIAAMLQQADPVQCREIIGRGAADIGIVTMTSNRVDSVVTIPAYKLPRCVVVPVGHPLIDLPAFTLAQLANYPIIAYPPPFSGRAIVRDTFAAAGLDPRIVCSATDADVSKAYVELGMGVAVLAMAAVDKVKDTGLVALDASHLFPPGILTFVFRKNGYVPHNVRAFIEILAPHLEMAQVLHAVSGAIVDQDAWTAKAPPLIT